MAKVVIFNEVNDRVIDFIESAHTPTYEGRTDVIINPLSIPSALRKYWKHDTGAIVEMDSTEKSTIDTEESDATDLSIRNAAKDPMDNLDSNGLVLRALADTIRDEINILRANHALSDRTLAQLKTSIKNRIDSGNVD